MCHNSDTKCSNGSGASPVVLPRVLTWKSHVSGHTTASNRLLNLKDRSSIGKVEYAKCVNRTWNRLTLWVISAALSFATTTIRIPTKKKGAGPLFQIRYGDKWGFMDRTGKTVIQPQFSDVNDFFDGLANVVVPVGNDYKSCFIDETGKTVIPCVFDRVGNFSEGLAPARVGRRWGYIDRWGKMVIQPQFQGAAEIHDGLGRVEVWDRIKCSEQTYTKDDAPTYAFDIHEGLFPLTTGCFVQHPRFGYVNKIGKMAIKPEFFIAEDFSEGLAAVRVEETAKTKYAFIDKTGKIVIPAQFDQADSFSEGLAAVQTGFRMVNGKKVAGKWGFIDKSGAFMISPRFDFARRFSEGLAQAETLDALGYIDRTGSVVIAPNYDLGSDFSEGLAAVWPSDEDGCVYIDRSGKKVVRIEGAQWPFSDGLTVAGEDGKRVYVDRNGRTIAQYEVSPEY